MASTSPDRLHLPAGRLEERFPDKKPLYDPSEAVAEANRCLYCVDAPCIAACPTAIDIPTFIRKIATGNVKGAARTILQQNLLGASCGQVCPVEVLCAGACVYNAWEREPIHIGRLQHFAVHEALEKQRRLFPLAPESGKKVALIGAGPASIAAAGWLALDGHRSVIFERKGIPGGLNTLGIAPYKMKGDAALEEIAWVLDLAEGRIEIRTGVEVVAGTAGEGQVAAADLLRDYDAVFLGLGLGADSALGVPGEDGPGVVGATAFIERLKADPTLTLEGVRRALVVGGGNTALDALHELALLGVDTTMVYRRSEAEMPGYDHELVGARIDGARLLENRVPIAVRRDGARLEGLVVARAEDGKPVAGSSEALHADLIVVAIGQSRATQVALAFPGVALDSRGRVTVDPATHRTGNPKVYSGGDCVNGGKEVVNAVAEARVAVRAMHQVFTSGGKYEIMADLSIDFCGIKSPNPFWLASAPPTNTGDQVMRAFDAGWGGAVWKTLGNPIVNVSSRFGGIDYGSTRLVGLNNIELITDRPLEVNLREIREVERRYPKHAVIASLMVETKEEWREIIQKAEDAGADGLELNFGCPHGMCERGMGSAVGNEPKVLEEIARWAVESAKTPVIVKLTPNIGDITEPGEAVVRSGAHAISLINTVKSIMGVDLDRMVPLPRVGGASTNGGYCGPAVKPIALHLLSQLARHPQCGRLPISGIGGIANWRDAAEFIALGSTSVQVCTAVMHYGYRIVEDMIEGLSDWLDEHGMKSVHELVGRAVPQYQEWGDLDLSYKVVADIDLEKCIGCQLCYVACMDGAHQCIHLPGRSEEQSRKAGHTHIPAHVPDRAVTAKAGSPGARVPYVDEDECIGCNLCALVCPVAGCITMAERDAGKAAETWNDRVQKGTDFVPGGLTATLKARAGR